MNTCALGGAPWLCACSRGLGLEMPGRTLGAVGRGFALGAQYMPRRTFEHVRSQYREP